MKDLFAVVYTNCLGNTILVNLSRNGKYENHDITGDVRIAREVAEYMTATVGKLGYRAVKVVLEELE